MATAVVGVLYFAALAFGTALSDDMATVAGRACLATLCALVALAYVA